MQRQVVEYALQRRRRLADVTAGRVQMEQVCDADRYLLRAAQYHGRPAETLCPICRKEQLTLVSWIFGDKLGSANGSARSAADIARLADETEEFTVHVVEVCRTCSWNHLVQSYATGLPPRPRRPRTRAGSTGGRKNDSGRDRAATSDAPAQQATSMEKYL